MYDIPDVPPQLAVAVTGLSGVSARTTGEAEFAVVRTNVADLVPAGMS